VRTQTTRENSPICLRISPGVAPEEVAELPRHPDSRHLYSSRRMSRPIASHPPLWDTLLSTVKFSRALLRAVTPVLKFRPGRENKPIPR